MPKHTGAQRNACDRCHTLKNRCVRRNNHGACERCERLRLQCNYSEKAKTGRPRQKPRENPLGSPAPTDDPSVLDKFQFSSGSVSKPVDPRLSSHGDANPQAATLGPHGNPDFDLQFDGVYSQVDPFNWLSASDGGLSPRLDAGVFEDMCFSESNEEASLRELLDMQTQLHALNMTQTQENARTRSRITGFHMPGPCNVSEMLVIMERLAGVLKSPSIGDGASPSQTASPQSVKDDGGSKNTLLLLHAFSCYASLLCLLKPLVTSLHGQCQGSSSDDRGPDDKSTAAAVSLGTFSLASRPALNARMTLSLISNLVDDLHSSALRATLCPLQNRSSDPTGPDSPSSALKKTRSPMMGAAMFVLDEVLHEEDFVLQKLRSCTLASTSHL